jgi:hypothetical protein
MDDKEIRARVTMRLSLSKERGIILDSGSIAFAKQNKQQSDRDERECRAVVDKV